MGRYPLEKVLLIQWDLSQKDISEFLFLFVSVFVCSLRYCEPQRAEILMDDCPWGADGFRQRCIFFYTV